MIIYTRLTDYVDSECAVLETFSLILYQMIHYSYRKKKRKKIFFLIRYFELLDGHPSLLPFNCFLKQSSLLIMTYIGSTYWRFLVDILP